MVGSTPYSARMAISSSALTSAYLVTASSSASIIKFGYFGCPWESGLSGKSQVPGDWYREIITVVLKWIFRIIKEFQGWVIWNRITDGILFFKTTFKLSNFLFFRKGVHGAFVGYIIEGLGENSVVFFNSKVHVCPKNKYLLDISLEKP